MIVRERAKVIEYLRKRNLVKPYLKAKKYLEKDQLKIVGFKIRQPKIEGVYYFRITKKYRAIGHFIHDIFVVASISDHQ
ncbi:MAG: hypothetical protein ACPGTO_10090 [Polaribacter sp.]